MTELAVIAALKQWPHTSLCTYTDIKFQIAVEKKVYVSLFFAFKSRSAPPR